MPNEKKIRAMLHSECVKSNLSTCKNSIMQNMYILQILSLKNKIILKYSKIIVDRHPYKKWEMKNRNMF